MRMSGPMRTAIISLATCSPQRTPASQCCGSTRRQPGGNWITSWGGGAPYITEQDASGTRVFTLTFTQGFVTYRTNPISPGVLSPTMLRAGMDAQYPR